MTTTAPDSFDRAWIERTAVLPADGDADRWEALALLGRVHEPHLAPLVRVSPVPDGVAVTHLVPAGAVPLSSLRAAAPLRAGHVVTVALAVLDALAALHDAGLAHGDVRAEHVLVAPDGGAVLWGSALAWSRAPGERGGPSPADDVDAVGELVRDLLGDGGGASALVIASLRASDPDPSGRPDALELRELVARCARPASLLDLLWAASGLRLDPQTSLTGAPAPDAQVGDPVDQPGPVEVPPGLAATTVPMGDVPSRGTALPARRRARTSPGAGGDRGRSRPSSRGGRVVAVVALAGVGLLLAGQVRSGRAAEAASATETGRPGSAPAAATSPPGATTPATPAASASGGSSSGAAADAAAGAALDLDRAAPGWLAVVNALDAARGSALASGSLTDLARAVDPTGAAWADDAALARRIASSHAEVRGGALEVVDLRVVDAHDVTVVLLVRDRRAAYSVTLDGRTTRVGERGERWWRLRLARSAAGWRIEEVAGVDDVDEPGAGSAVSTPRAP